MNDASNEKIIYREESHVIQGAIFEVYREMGCGFLEDVYQECLAREFSMRGIPHLERPELKLRYKGEMLLQFYKPDFVCHHRIIIELKAVTKLAPEHAAQLLNYLKATGMKLGLLVNFGSYPKATVKRYVL